jgi:creatinine amidohydrolase
MHPIHLADLRPADLKKIAREKPLILVPIGTTEWHADHLPVGVDNLLSQATCDAVSAGTGCVVAPPVPFGICSNLNPEKGYFGTVDTIQVETLTALLAELGVSYAKMGFKKAVLFTGHGEPNHWEAIQAAISRTKTMDMVMLSAFDFSKDKVQELDDVEKTWPFAGDHAAEWETSMMLHYYPGLVDMSLAPETIELRMPGIPEYIQKRYPRRASKSYGKELAEAITSGGITMINQLLEALSSTS